MAKSNATGWLAFGYLFGMVAYCLGPAWSAQSIDAVSLFRVMFVIAVAIPVFGILKTTSVSYTHLTLPTIYSV